MVGTVMNCKKCNRIFQQRLQPICPECIRLEEEQLTTLYRLLQSSASTGGLDINTLAIKIGMTEENIEKLYMEGRLGTAGLYLKMPCQACGSMCGEAQRRGRFCYSCSELTASRAGVEVKSIRDLQRENAEEQRRQQQETLLKENRSHLQKQLHKQEEISRFGFTVRHR